MYIDNKGNERTNRSMKKGHPFYGSSKWKTVRLQYLATVHHVCEFCGKPAEQVHHKDPLKEEDYFVNYNKCYGFDNLQALCRSCHNRMEGHFLYEKSHQAIAQGYRINMVTGELEATPPIPLGESPKEKPLAFPPVYLEKER